MKIRISTLSSEGLQIKDTIPVSDLNTRLQEGSPCEIVFTEDPAVNLVISRKPHGAETKGTVIGRCRQRCARCDETVERTISAPVDYILRRQPETGARFEDDIGLLYFEGDHADLEEAIQEQLILSLSPFWSPPLDGNDRCTACQRCFNSVNTAADNAGGTTRMQDLLSRAAKKKSG